MASKSKARLMAAASHDAGFAKKVGIPMAVAKEYNRADTGTGLLADAMRVMRKRNRKR